MRSSDAIVAEQLTKLSTGVLVVFLVLYTISPLLIALWRRQAAKGVSFVLLPLDPSPAYTKGTPHTSIPLPSHTSSSSTLPTPSTSTSILPYSGGPKAVIVASGPTSNSPTSPPHDNRNSSTPIPIRGASPTLPPSASGIDAQDAFQPRSCSPFEAFREETYYASGEPGVVWGR